MALILASETKFVLKDQVSGAGAALDFYILLEVAVYAAVGGYATLRLTRNPPRIRPPALLLGLLHLVFLMTVSIPLAASPIYAAIRALEMTVWLLVAVVAVTQAPARWFPRFASTFVVATGALVAIGVLAPSIRGPLQQDRFNWLATHPVVAGQFLALAAVAALVLAVGRQWREPRATPPVLYWGLLGVFCVALAANNTRGAAAAAVAGVAVALVLALPRRLWVSAGLVAGYFGLIILLTSNDMIAQWLLREEGIERLGSLNARLPLWRTAVGTVLETHPFFGFGVGASRSIFVDETGLGGAHNAAINVFVDLGFAGLVVWVALIGYSVWLAIRSRPLTESQAIERALWLSTMTVLLVNGLTTEGLGGVAGVGMGWLFLLVARVALLTDVSKPTRRTRRRVVSNLLKNTQREEPHDQHQLSAR